MTISNQEFYSIDQTVAYTQKTLFLPAERLEVLAPELDAIGADQMLDRDNEVFGELYDDIQHFIITANNMYYRYDIEGFEPIKYYELVPGSELQELYVHSSMIPNTESYRKITFILNVNSDYEGGSLQLFRHDGVFRDTVKSAGSFIAFSSFTPYRIQPVLEGTKKILIGNVYGSRFR